MYLPGLHSLVDLTLKPPIPPNPPPQAPGGEHSAPRIPRGPRAPLVRGRPLREGAHHHRRRF